MLLLYRVLLLQNPFDSILVTALHRDYILQNTEFGFISVTVKSFNQSTILNFFAFVLNMIFVCEIFSAQTLITQM